MNTIDKIDKKVSKLHTKLTIELNKMAFPKSREYAARKLEQKIHDMSFQPLIDKEEEEYKHEIKN